MVCGCVAGGASSQKPAQSICVLARFRIARDLEFLEILGPRLSYPSFFLKKNPMGPVIFRKVGVHRFDLLQKLLNINVRGAGPKPASTSNAQ